MPTHKIQGFGWKKDPPDFRDQRYLVATAVLQNLPPQVDLRPQSPPIYDQGPIGSCTANAIAGAIEYDRKKVGAQPAFVPSRLFIYWNERNLEHTVPNDAGAHLRDGVKSVNQLGVCAEPTWPYVPTPAPYEGGPFPPGSPPVTQPPTAAYTEAAHYTAATYARLPQTSSQLRGCLAEGFPFVFGFTVYDSLYDLQGQPRTHIPLPAQNDVAIAGHAVCAVGYNDATQEFIIRNSWGTAIGDNGYFYMPYAYLTDPDLSSDFWVIRTLSN